MTTGGTLGLSGVILLLGGTIAYELTDGEARPHHSPTSSKPPPVVANVSHAGSPRGDIASQVNEILARPIFSPDRRPVSAGVHAIAGLSRLTGIVVIGSRKVAIFAASPGGKPVIAEEGSRINAYEVKAISESGVTVVGPGGTQVMTPNFDPAPPAAPRPPAMPEAAQTPHRTAGGRL